MGKSFSLEKCCELQQFFNLQKKKNVHVQGKNYCVSKLLVQYIHIYFT